MFPTSLCQEDVHTAFMCLSSVSWNPNCRKLGGSTIVGVSLKTNNSSPLVRKSLLYCACVSSFLMQNLAWAFGYVMST